MKYINTYNISFTEVGIDTVVPEDMDCVPVKYISNNIQYAVYLGIVTF